MLQETLDQHSSELRGYLKEVQRVYQGSIKDILRMFREFLKNVSSGYPGTFKKVSRMFQ